MRRLVVLTVPLLAVALLLAGAGPAGAHQEISPGTVPTGQPAFLFLTAANERRAELTRVTLAAPAGGRFGHATRDPAGWASTLSHTEITWTGGAVQPERFEQFGFDVEPIDQPGALTYRATLTYADGVTQQLDVPLTVRAAPETGAPAPPPATAAPTTTTPAAAEEEPAPEAVPVAGEEEGDGLAVLATVLAGVALVVAVGAAVVAVRGRRPGREPSPAPAGRGQDW